MSGPCSLCIGTMPEGEWCRACGYGLPEQSLPVEPMKPIPLAIRRAKGGWLTTDGPREREEYRLAVERERQIAEGKD